jgi:hypothetical protein
MPLVKKLPTATVAKEKKSVENNSEIKRMMMRQE